MPTPESKPPTPSALVIDEDALIWLRDTVSTHVVRIQARLDPPPSDQSRRNALRWEMVQARKVAHVLGRRALGLPN